AGAVILNKTDLLPYTNFNAEAFDTDLSAINPRVTLFKISATRGDGLQGWFDWMEKQLNSL
ncbi:MAG: hydrogenase accessory protein HypB, partial [Bacteroidales bacterium]